MITQPLPLFEQLSDESRTLLHNNHQTYQLSKQEVALHKGDQVSGAYIVTRGCLRVYTYMPNGTESTLYLINAGETCVFAINCLFNQLLYPAWVTAETDTEVTVVNGSLYRQLFRQDPAIQNLTINALSTAVFRLMTEVEQLQGWKLNQRLANLLLSRASDSHVVLMTQQEIANQLGTGREVVARVLGEFVQQSLIETRRGRITLLNSKVLSELLMQ